MDNKIIALIIIVILVIIGGVYFFATQNNNNSTLNYTNNSTINTTNNSTQTTNQGNTTQNTTANIKISSKQAQQIAISSTKDLTGENDTAGTPTLFRWTTNNHHTWVWKVPLTNTATGKTGSLDIDAITGEVILNE